MCKRFLVKTNMVGFGTDNLFDSDKIRDTLELNKSKPKKKGGFQAKLETMMKEQQRIQQEKAKNKK